MKTIYTCEFCNKTYSTSTEALNCERTCDKNSKELFKKHLKWIVKKALSDTKDGEARFHVVINDLNIEDSSIEFCYSQRHLIKNSENYLLNIALYHLLIDLTENERLELLRTDWED